MKNKIILRKKNTAHITHSKSRNIWRCTCRIALFAFFTLTIATLTSCKSSPQKNAIVIRKLDAPLFWEIESPTGTKIYVMGLIHLGTKETEKIAEYAVEKFISVDEFYTELSIADQIKLNDEIFENDMGISASPQSTAPDAVSKFISASELASLKEISEKYLFEPTGAALSSSALASSMMDSLFKSMANRPAWYWNYFIESSQKNFDAKLRTDYVLYMNAFQNKKPILGIDNVDEYIELMTRGTGEEPIVQLKKMIAGFQKTGSVKKLDEREKLIKYYIEKNYTELEKSLMNLYEYNALSKLNNVWAEKITELMQEENKTYFVLGIASRWIGKNNVFDLMKRKKIIWKMA